MLELFHEVQRARDRHEPESKDPAELISCWREDDVVDGEPIDALTIIFRTTGCTWSNHMGCSMCGYFADTDQAVTGDDILDQFEAAMEQWDGEPLVKIYTSGSWVDRAEIPPDTARTILSELEGRAERVIVESLPGYINDEAVETLSHHPDVHVAMGLESASDLVLTHSVTKPITFEAFERAASRLDDAGIGVKAYVLLKPPFLSEGEAIRDTVRSVEKAAPHAETISINPVNVQRHTLVERLWHRDQYRPPWLWSIAEALERTADVDAWVKSHPVGAGKPRGPRNCGECDVAVERAIEDFSLRQDPAVLSEPGCACREAWRDAVEVGDLTRSLGAPVVDGRLGT